MRNPHERGHAMIEAALIFSMLMAIILGLFRVGGEMLTHHFVWYAAREATRYASVHGSKSGEPATSRSVETYVKQLAVGVDPAAVKVKTEWIPDNSPGSTVRVEIQSGEIRGSSQVTVLH